jgi:NO-binding membrane sensor protein with MHYT domain
MYTASGQLSPAGGNMLADIDHFTYGSVTPVLAYAMSVLGSLLGLTCTAQARAARTTGRRAWFLGLAAWAIGGTGIWVMHFIAMIGFGVDGSEIRYDVPITTASAIIAIGVVAVGLAVAGFGKPHPLKIIIGGVFAGLGVASMHYTGMAAMRFHGNVVYDDLLVAASIAIAVVAATVALWFTVTVRKTGAIIASALVMGVAVSGMHYTAMFAMTVHLDDSGSALTGSTPFGLLLPIVLLVIFVIMGLFYAVLAAPTDEDRAGAAYLDARLTGQPGGAAGPPVSAPPAAGVPPPTGMPPPGMPPTGTPPTSPAPPVNGVRRVNGHPAPAVRRTPTPTVGSSFRRRGTSERPR